MDNPGTPRSINTQVEISSQTTPKEALDAIVRYFSDNLEPSLVLGYLATVNVTIQSVIIQAVILKHDELVTGLKKCMISSDITPISSPVPSSSSDPDSASDAIDADPSEVDEPEEVDLKEVERLVKVNDFDLDHFQGDLYEYVRRVSWEQTYTRGTFRAELSFKLNEGGFKTIKEARLWTRQRILKFIRIVTFGSATQYVIIKVIKGMPPVITKHSKFKQEYGASNGYSIFIDEKQRYDYYLDAIRNQDTVYDWYNHIPFGNFEDDPVLEMNKGNDKTFNGFRRYPAQIIPNDKVDQELIMPILDHIYYVWAGGGDLVPADPKDDAKTAAIKAKAVEDADERYRWIMAWLTYLVKYPREHLPMLTIVGKEGTGKTCLITGFLFKYVFGYWNSIEVSNLDMVVRDFNAQLEGKTLVYIAELQGTTIADNNLHRKMEQLKPLITDDTINIEQKGIDIRTVMNAGHYIASSNDEFCLRLSESNRRHVVFKTSDCYKGDGTYFDNLFASFNQDVADHFYSFLYHLEVSNLPNPIKVLETELVKDMQELSLPPPALFLKRLRDRELTLSISKTDNRIRIRKDHILIEKPYLFSLYEKWTKTVGYSICQDRHFYMHLKDKVRDIRPDSYGPRYYMCDEVWFNYDTFDPLSLLRPIE